MLPKRMRRESPDSSLKPTKTRSNPKTTPSARLAATLWSSAPASPPPALGIPKRISTALSTCPRKRPNLSTVAKKCGMEIAATARRVPTLVASSGVSTLPIPNPVMLAMLPAIAAAMKTTI